MIITNLNIQPHADYKIGLYAKETWELIFNSDDPKYWGSGYQTKTTCKTVKNEWNGRNHTLEVDVPPLSVTVYRLISSVPDKIKQVKVKAEKANTSKPKPSKKEIKK